MVFFVTCKGSETQGGEGIQRSADTCGELSKSNVVPCCYECNCARNNNFSHEEMKEIGKAIKQIKINRGTYRSNIGMVNKIRIERGYEPLN